MFHSNLGNAISDIKCSRGPQVPHPWAKQCLFLGDRRLKDHGAIICSYCWGVVHVRHGGGCKYTRHIGMCVRRRANAASQPEKSGTAEIPSAAIGRELLVPERVALICLNRERWSSKCLVFFVLIHFRERQLTNHIGWDFLPSTSGVAVGHRVMLQTPPAAMLVSVNY